MLSQFKSSGMVIIPELSTKENAVVFVKVELHYDSAVVFFFPKTTMHGRSINWNGSYYYANIKIDDVGFIEDCINRWIHKHELYLGDTRLKDYTFTDHSDRICECARNLYDRKTAEWLVGDTLDDVYDEMLEEEERKVNELIMARDLMDSINYLDCVVA